MKTKIFGIVIMLSLAVLNFESMRLERKNEEFARAQKRAEAVSLDQQLAQMGFTSLPPEQPVRRVEARPLPYSHHDLDLKVEIARDQADRALRRAELETQTLNAMLQTPAPAAPVPAVQWRIVQVVPYP